MQTYLKALVPTVVGAILLLASHFGIMEDMTMKEFLTFVLTSGIVYFVPNKQPVEA
jgi:hypothetical protein